MSNKQQLQSNNTKLASLIQTLAGKAVGDSSNTEQATPVISINSSTGLVTATAGTKASTYQLAFQPAKTITPKATSQIAVSSGYYTGGNVTVAGDSNLVAGNIKSGVSIFGVNGTFVGSGTGGEPDYSGEDSLVTKTVSTYTNDRVTDIGSHAFYYCSRLATVSFPQATTIGVSAFYYCSRLATVSFPQATTIGASAFDNCSRLATVSFPQATTIGDNAFYRCVNLKSLYLTGSSVCTLSNSNTFTSTPIGGYSASAGTYGSIYVPASLVDAYKSATNWTYFSSRFVGIAASANLINFTIDGTSYQAEEGMTWGNWINSAYNTGGFIAQLADGTGCVLTSARTSIWKTDDSNYNQVMTTDIIESTAYSISEGGWVPPEEEEWD